MVNWVEKKTVITRMLAGCRVAVAVICFLLYASSSHAITIDITTGTYPFSFDGTTFGTGGVAVPINGGVVSSSGVITGGSIILNTDIKITEFDTVAGDGIAIAGFGTSATSNPDFALFDNLSNLLFAGDFGSLTAFGIEGSGAGGAVATLALSGDVTITAGSIFGFGPGTSLTATFKIDNPTSGLPTDVFVDDGSGKGKTFSGYASSTFSGEAASIPVPEPSTLLLIGSGLLGLGIIGRRRKSNE